MLQGRVADGTLWHARHEAHRVAQLGQPHGHIGLRATIAGLKTVALRQAVCTRLRQTEKNLSKGNHCHSDIVAICTKGSKFFVAKQNYAERNVKLIIFLLESS